MKKTPRRRITVTSSLNEISTDQLGNGMVRGSSFRPHPCLQEASRHIFEDDVNGFFSQRFLMSPLRHSFVLVPKSSIIVAKLKNCKLYCAQVRNTKVVSKTQRWVKILERLANYAFERALKEEGMRLFFCFHTLHSTIHTRESQLSDLWCVLS